MLTLRKASLFFVVIAVVFWSMPAFALILYPNNREGISLHFDISGASPMFLETDTYSGTQKLKGKSVQQSIGVQYNFANTLGIGLAVEAYEASALKKCNSITDECFKQKEVFLITPNLYLRIYPVGGLRLTLSAGYGFMYGKYVDTQNEFEESRTSKGIMYGGGIGYELRVSKRFAIGADVIIKAGTFLSTRFDGLFVITPRISLSWYL